MKRIIICGGRDFQDMDFFIRSMQQILQLYPDVEIVSGHASRGADRMGEAFAKSYNLPLKLFPAQWDTYGKSAGYRRNSQMLDYIRQEEPVVVAFWDGSSRGTQHMISIAQKANVPTHIFRYK